MPQSNLTAVVQCWRHDRWALTWGHTHTPPQASCHNVGVCLCDAQGLVNMSKDDTTKHASQDEDGYEPSTHKPASNSHLAAKHSTFNSQDRQHCNLNCHLTNLDSAARNQLNCWAAELLSLLLLAVLEHQVIAPQLLHLLLQELCFCLRLFQPVLRL